MAATLASITPSPLNLAALIDAVSAPGHGAVASFVGLVRNENLNRRVTHLEYEAYEPLAERALDRILTEARAQWPAVRLGVHHRIGHLAIGESSVIIAAAAAHRADAFAVCRYAIERVKQIAPIWKHEFFDGGDVWIEGATADPEDDSARRAALGRAGVEAGTAAAERPCA